MVTSRSLAIIGCFVVLLMAAVNPVEGLAATPSQEVVTRDYWPTDGWRTSTPEDQGMDSAPLYELMDKIEDRAIAIDSVLIAKNGYVVLEEYPRQYYDNESRHIIHSCTKSLTSALMGIAIEQGFINSTQDRLVDFFPNRTIANLNESKETITLENLLMMNSGIEWDEWTYSYGSSQNSLNQMWDASDTVQHYLDLPMAYEPGEDWTYSSGGSHVLGAIIADMTGSSLLDYAEDNLFTPLGISTSDVFWPTDNQGYYWASGGVEMLPLDMLKFGYLYLNNGSWNGEQIVPFDWVQTSSDTLTNFNDFSGYSYQWWTYPTEIVNVYAAQGYQGQYIYVIPELDMVVVFTSTVSPSLAGIHSTYLFDYIVSAALPSVSHGFANAQTITLMILIIVPIPAIVGGVYFLYKKEEL